MSYVVTYKRGNLRWTTRMSENELYQLWINKCYQILNVKVA